MDDNASDAHNDEYEETPCAHLTLLPDGTITRANSTFFGWIGCTKETVLTHKKIQDFLGMGYRIFYETHFAPLLAMQGVLKEITMDLMRNDRKPLPVLMNARQIKDQQGGSGCNSSRSSGYN